MATATIRTRSKTRKARLGPADHGRKLTYEAFLSGNYELGHKYELIDGKLYVSPFGDFPHDCVRQHILDVLILYQHRRPNLVARISAHARVFVPNRKKDTCPSPDVAIYRICPPGPHLDWIDISPIIVVEVVSPDDPYKDYVRNVDLYQRVPSIREYWVFDRCREANGPNLTVYHRESGRKKWKTSTFGPEDIYTTSLLPGLKLPVCPPK